MEYVLSLCLNHLLASYAYMSLITSGADRFSAAETARTAKKGLKFGLAYGAVQDLLSLAKGRPVGYVEFIRRHVGKATQFEEKTT